jgi:ubiquinone/menaquinone biosynthesis C-methylase UbiE
VRESCATEDAVADRNTAFIGSIPENYDRYLGPLFFHGYADDLVARVPMTPGMRVLETACGTGIVTARLVARLAEQGTLIATDLNEAMFAHAATRVGAERVEWRQADATALPFDDRSFDAVVAQFGMMFYPDKTRGVREAFRVLKPGGAYVFNVWATIEQNPVARITHETVASFFATDAPQFYTVPFSLSETATVSGWLKDAGFVDIDPVSVAKIGTSPSAADAAIGLIEGNPIYIAIMERKPEALADIKAAVARNVAAELGDRPVRAPLRAFVFSARKP